MRILLAAILILRLGVPNTFAQTVDVATEPAGGANGGGGGGGGGGGRSSGGGGIAGGDGADLQAGGRLPVVYFGLPDF